MSTSHWARSAQITETAPVCPILAEDIVLHMAVPDWPPTRIMKDLADKLYHAPSGNKSAVRERTRFAPSCVRTTVARPDSWYFI